jgi:hypothetical protein
MSQIGKHKRNGGFLAPAVIGVVLLGLVLILWKYAM